MHGDVYVKTCLFLCSWPCTCSGSCSCSCSCSSFCSWYCSCSCSYVRFTLHVPICLMTVLRKSCALLSLINSSIFSHYQHHWFLDFSLIISIIGSSIFLSLSASLVPWFFLPSLLTSLVLWFCFPSSALKV